jgi:cytochrome c553
MKTIERYTALALLMVGSVLSVTSHAADPNAGRNLSATCALCHGTDGKSVGTFPALAGQDRAALVGKLKDFKAGKGSPTIMHQISKGFSDEQIDLMAAYYSAQR